MATTNASLVRQRQEPLRNRYRKEPAAAWIQDGAKTIDACSSDAFHGAVLPANSVDAPLRFGIHRAVGGNHDYPNPGDLLSAALAACLDSTVRMIADHLDIRLTSLDVAVEADCDVRGCLLVDPSVPVGFQSMRCRVRMQPEGMVEPQRLQMLIAAAERSCVVLQTLRNGVSVQTHVDANDRATVATAH